MCMRPIRYAYAKNVCVHPCIITKNINVTNIWRLKTPTCVQIWRKRGFMTPEFGQRTCSTDEMLKCVFCLASIASVLSQFWYSEKRIVGER